MGSHPQQSTAVPGASQGDAAQHAMIRRSAAQVGAGWGAASQIAVPQSGVAQRGGVRDCAAQDSAMQAGLLQQATVLRSARRADPPTAEPVSLQLVSGSFYCYFEGTSLPRMSFPAPLQVTSLCKSQVQGHQKELTGSPVF